MAEVEMASPLWADLLKGVKDLHAETVKTNKTAKFVAMGVLCPPLSITLLPFGGMEVLAKGVSIIPEWKRFLSDDVEKGRKFMVFGR